MNTQNIDFSQFYVPTRQEVESVQVGAQAMDCFGKMSEVVEVFGRGDDINGRAYVCFYTRFGSDGGTISHSLKEAELVRCTPVTGKYTSWELDDIEKAINDSRKPIVVSNPYADQRIPFYPVGIGAYPYDCRAKDKYPGSMVYEDKSGGWIASHELTDTGFGYFEVR